jgi:hypothetical protein
MRSSLAWNATPPCWLADTSSETATSSRRPVGTGDELVWMTAERWVDRRPTTIGQVTDKSEVVDTKGKRSR